MIPRLAWVGPGAVAVMATGLLAMWTAGAPGGLVTAQGIGGLIALALAAGLAHRRPDPDARATWVIAAVSLVLLASPFLSPGVDGTHRWIGVHGFQIQPSALALPVLVWIAGRAVPDRLGAGLLAASALILAAQPDRQGAAGVVAALAALSGLHVPRPLWIGALIVAATGVYLAGVQPEIAPVPYVEQVLRLSFEADVWQGLLVGLALVAMPLLMLAAGRGTGPVPVGLAALWVGLAVAGATEFFPVPVLGYGLSWVMGFGLSLGLAAASADDGR